MQQRFIPLLHRFISAKCDFNICVWLSVLIFHAMFSFHLYSSSYPLLNRFQESDKLFIRMCNFTLLYHELSNDRQHYIIETIPYRFEQTSKSAIKQDYISDSKILISFFLLLWNFSYVSLLQHVCSFKQQLCLLRIRTHISYFEHIIGTLACFTYHVSHYELLNSQTGITFLRTLLSHVWSAVFCQLFL